MQTLWAELGRGIFTPVSCAWCLFCSVASSQADTLQLSSLQRFPRRSTQLWIQLKKKEEVCHVFLHQLVVLSVYKTCALTASHRETQKERGWEMEKKGRGSEFLEACQSWWKTTAELIYFHAHLNPRTQRRHHLITKSSSPSPLSPSPSSPSFQPSLPAALIKMYLKFFFLVNKSSWLRGD